MAAAANPDTSPLDFLLGVMRDPNVSLEIRIRVAQAAAPFIHGKPGAARLSDPAASAKSIDDGCGFTIVPVARALRDDYERLNELGRKKYGPSEYGGPLSAAEKQEEPWLRTRIAKMAKEIECPAGYKGSVQAKKDSHRLHRLSRKRMSPPSCGGGALTDAEDAEEAQLTARSLVLKQTPEAVARRRIFELVPTFSKVLSPAEQSELDRLKALYPDRPLDPNDPSFRAIQAFDAYLERRSER